MKKINFKAVSPFYMNIEHTVSSTPSDAHVHQECEIYVNVSGNVSFMVENNLYPVFRGNAIITKPYEFHNCIYHDNSPHEHYWITFDVSNNQDFLSLFFDRKIGNGNLIVLDDEKTEKLLDVCKQLDENNLNEIEKYACFFKLISLLNEGDFKENADTKNLPQDVLIAVNYINKNLTNKISLDDIANYANVSVNSLERHFISTLNMTPYTYVQKKRLALSAKLLSKNKSVTDACFESGFTDYPHYIALFKKYYGLTPLKYKKTILK